MLHIIDTKRQETSHLLPQVENILGSYQVPYMVHQPAGKGDYRAQVEPLGKMMEKAQMGDQVLLLDAFNPALLTEGCQQAIGHHGLAVVGFFHDSARAPGSRLYQQAWAAHAEDAIGRVLDESWVATDYLKQYLPWSRVAFPSKLTRPDAFRPFTEKPVVVWPHAPQGPGFHLFVRVAELLSHRYEFVAFGDGASEHIRYFDEKARYDVYSTSHFVMSENRETFCHEVIEAVHCGCRPILSNEPFHLELFGERYTFTKNEPEAAAKALDTKLGQHPYDERVLDTVMGRASDFVGRLLAVCQW